MKLKLPMLSLFISSIILWNGQAEGNGMDNDDHHSAGWATIGIGSCYFGPTVLLGLTYAYDDNLFTFRYLHGDEVSFNVEGNYDEPALRCNEIGILYGRSFRKESLILSLSAGIGMMQGTDRGKQITYHHFEEKNISSVGIPFETKVRIELGFAAFGGSWFGNLNARRTISGVMLEISIGIF